MKDPTIAKHGQVEAQLEGVMDKKGMAWRRVFCTLETDGVLSLSARANLRGGVMRDPRLGALQVMGLARCQEEADWIAQGIDQGMDLGAQSAFAAPDRLVFAVFFWAPALC